MSFHSQRQRASWLRRACFVPCVETLENRESPTVLFQAGSGLADWARPGAGPTSTPHQAAHVKPLFAVGDRLFAADSPVGTDSNWLPEPARQSVQVTAADNQTVSAAPGLPPATEPGLTDLFANEPWANADQPRRLPVLDDAATRTSFSGGPAAQGPVAGTGTFVTTGQAGIRREGMAASDLLWLSAASQNGILSARPPTTGGDEITTPTYGGFTETLWRRDAVSLSQTSGMAWAPDGSNRLFIIQKTGQVRILFDGYTLPTPFATMSPIYTSSECGLIGIAFDPNYTINGYVYFFVTVSSSEQQIIRYTDSGNVGTNRTVILPGLPTVGANHDGGAIGFGFDGKLYFAIGDLGNGTGVNNNLTSLASKVGRANADGSIPADNPFHDGPGPNNDYIWARGFRNPYTFTFQPSTGQLWVNVVGTSYEQVMEVTRGSHAGWNMYENNQPAGFLQPKIKYRTNGTDTRTITATGAVRSGGVTTFTTTATHGFRAGEQLTISGVTNTSFNGRVIVYDTPTATTFRVFQAGADASSGSGSAVTDNYGGAILGGTFYDGTQFPTDYWDNYFFGDYNSGRYYRTYLYGENNDVALVDLFATGLGSFIDTETGPDGSLYSVNFNGTVYRLTANVNEQKIVIGRRHINLIEGNVGVYNVSLAQAPAGAVTVQVTPFGDPDLYVFNDTLTFTPNNWNVPQPVYLYAGEDDDTDYDVMYMEVSSPGLASQYVGVFVYDNDL